MYLVRDHLKELNIIKLRPTKEMCVVMHSISQYFSTYVHDMLGSLIKEIDVP